MTFMTVYLTYTSLGICLLPRHLNMWPNVPGEGLVTSLFVVAGLHLQYCIICCAAWLDWKFPSCFFNCVLTYFNCIFWSSYFLQVTNGNCQIVNIGAGFDTLYWRLVDEGKSVKGFVELDFPGVTSRKCLYIQRTKQLLQAISDEGT